jgi:hypothetical protein
MFNTAQSQGDSPQTFHELSTNSKGGMVIVVILIVVLSVLAYFVYSKNPSAKGQLTQRQEEVNY